ncbi:hypothetical protein FJ365_04470 [Candidatus Dependentiae bacterium]|nr:hypothetical protein [Candidatus Dependentiae bacterium]
MISHYLLFLLIITSSLNPATPAGLANSSSTESLEEAADDRRALLPRFTPASEPRSSDCCNADWGKRCCTKYCKEECCNRETCCNVCKVFGVACCITADIVALAAGLIYGCGLHQ